MRQKNKNKKTVRHVLETVTYRTPLLCVKLPGKYKTLTSLNSLKQRLKHGNLKHVFVGYARPINKLYDFHNVKFFLMFSGGGKMHHWTEIG